MSDFLDSLVTRSTATVLPGRPSAEALLAPSLPSRFESHLERAVGPDDTRTLDEGREVGASEAAPGQAATVDDALADRGGSSIEPAARQFPHAKAAESRWIPAPDDGSQPSLSAAPLASPGDHGYQGPNEALARSLDRVPEFLATHHKAPFGDDESSATPRVRPESASVVVPQIPHAPQVQTTVESVGAPAAVPPPQIVPEYAPSGSGSSSAVVHVTIGRVEVRGVREPAAPVRRGDAPKSKVMTLEQYLERRAAGGRS